MNGNEAAGTYNGEVTPTLDFGVRWTSARSQFFRVEISGVNLGMFSKCEGLGAEVAVEKREEGGTNGFVYHLAGRVTYPNIKITRPVNAHSAAIGQLFTAMNDPAASRTATISALDTDGKSIASWTLLNVTVVRWTGPSFGTDSAAAATETLEFAHQGFGSVS